KPPCPQQCAVILKSRENAHVAVSSPNPAAPHIEIVRVSSGDTTSGPISGNGSSNSGQATLRRALWQRNRRGRGRIAAGLRLSALLHFRSFAKKQHPYRDRC